MAIYVAFYSPSTVCGLCIMLCSVVIDRSDPATEVCPHNIPFRETPTLCAPHSSVCQFPGMSGIPPLPLKSRVAQKEVLVKTQIVNRGALANLHGRSREQAAAASRCSFEVTLADPPGASSIILSMAAELNDWFFRK